MGDALATVKPESTLTMRLSLVLIDRRDPLPLRPDQGPPRRTRPHYAQLLTTRRGRLPPSGEVRLEVIEAPESWGGPLDVAVLG